MDKTVRVTVWNEFLHEKQSPEIGKIYTDGIHGAIAKHLSAKGFKVRTASLDMPEHGLTDKVLSDTDVLIWWGHMAHDRVSDAVVDKIYHRITYGGMGLIVLHSGHYSKIFRRLMGTSCGLKWREAGEKERLWVVSPGHPIAAGLDEYFEIEHTEMYGEYFDIPTPDHLVLVSWFQGGEVFRSGCCFYRGKGKIFYFRPGHESFPIFYHPKVLQVLENAARWAAPVDGPNPPTITGAPNAKSLEKLP